MIFTITGILLLFCAGLKFTNVRLEREIKELRQNLELGRVNLELERANLSACRAQIDAQNKAINAMKITPPRVEFKKIYVPRADAKCEQKLKFYERLFHEN